MTKRAAPAPPRVLAIAGSDSSGGAGIQADLKTITMLGGYAMTAITAITAQNTVGVQGVAMLDPALVAAQIAACRDDIGVDAVKIGMLGDAGIVRAVVAALAGFEGPVVLDPVLVATSGAPLSDDPTMQAMVEELFPLAGLVTPNLPELARLTGMPVTSPDAIDEAARALHRMAGCAVLAKGGHMPGDQLADILVNPPRPTLSFADARIATRHTHGTGCTLSSAIATELGRGASLEDAITRARSFVRAAIRAAPGFGAGAGPLGHAAVRRLSQR